MKKTLIGISLFLTQLSLAVFYNGTIDLNVFLVLFSCTFLYILYNYRRQKYSSCELPPRQKSANA